MKSVRYLGLSRYVAGITLLPFCLLALAVSAEEGKWYEKSFEEILNSRVVTATRTESSLKNAPGVVTVFSGEEIQLMGLKSLKEVLERTTGFFINRQLNGATVGSRGYIADTDQFLLLIDGHNMNSIIDKGMGDQFLFPNLEYVSRIEIIRGPGSTLWGSDAALGIIHVITKTGADIDGAKVTYNYSKENRESHLNLLFGTEIAEDTNIMASFTAASSEGFEPKSNISGEAFPLVVGNWDEIKDSYEFYAKAQVGKFVFKARAYESIISRPYLDFDPVTWLPVHNGVNVYNRRNHFYLDVTHTNDINEKLSVESRLFMDNLDRTQELISPKLDKSATMGQESEASQENALGIEIITRWQALDNLFFMLGYRGVETALSPWTYELHYSINATSQTGAGEVYQYVVPAENDVSQAIFAEYEWAIIPNTLTLLMGARVDDNNLREDETIFLPRLAVNWHIDNNWGTKYSYNTGYIRPGVGVGFLGQHQYNASIGKPIVGATESQEVSSHDLQLSFMSQKSVTNLNFYYNTIKKPFQIIYDDAAVINGEQVVVFYTNIEQTDTYGLELESKYIFDEVWDTYFSLSKVFSAKTKSMTGTSNGYSYDLNSTAFARGAFTPDGDMQGFPNFMLHAGVNFHMMDNLASNLHFRYWDEMEIRKPFSANGELLELDPQLFVDFNITYTEIAGSGVDLSFYVKNVLDNDDAGVYLFLWDNVWQAQGRRVGASFAYKF